MARKTKSAQYVIDGLNVTVTKSNIHIQDSWQIRRRKDIKAFLQKLELEIGFRFESPFDHLSINSMVREWVAHNNLYLIGFKRDRTGSVDINWPKKWYANLAYFLLGMIAF